MAKSQKKEERTVLTTGHRNAKPAAWSEESKRSVEKFGREYCRLLPLIGAPVLTPRGTGWLIQVFHDRALVLLDSNNTNDKTQRFTTNDIQPIQGEKYGVTRPENAAKPVTEKEARNIRAKAAARGAG